MSDAAVLTAQTADQVLATWLDQFNAALADRDAGAVADLFTTDSFWRDLVALTWNLKTVEGREGVRDMLEHTLGRAQPGGFHATEPADRGRRRGRGVAGVRDRGRARQRPPPAQGRTGLDAADHALELKGHEEPPRRDAPDGRRARGQRRPRVVAGAPPARGRRARIRRPNPRC